MLAFSTTVAPAVFSSADVIDNFSLFLAIRPLTISPLFPSKSEHSCPASRMYLPVGGNMDHKVNPEIRTSDGDSGGIASKQKLALKLWFCSSLTISRALRGAWRSTPTRWCCAPRGLGRLTSPALTVRKGAAASESQKYEIIEEVS